MYVTKKDIDLATNILKEELIIGYIENRTEDIEMIVESVLNTVYSIGGGYTENTIRNVANSMLEKKII
jgi:hypothetical protein